MGERWIGVESPDEWRDALRGIAHSFAHTWDYCRAMQSYSGRPTFLYEARTTAGRFVCPIQERSFHGMADVVTPPGFSGFVGEGDSHGLWDLWRRSAQARRYVCGYLVMNPALPSTVTLPAESRRRDKHVYVMDLTASVDELHARLDQNRRRQIRNWEAVAAGLTTDRGRVTAFILDNYEAFFAGRNASSTHGLSRTSATSLAALESVFMVGADDGGEITAAAMFGCTHSGGDYLFGVSRPEGRRRSAALVWAAVLQLKAWGIPHMNLGGGLTAGDGIAAFKQRFGAARMALPVLAEVYDRAKYEELCRRAGADARSSRGYFPAYRQLGVERATASSHGS
ncbi:hypothetical protein [Geodermatophilus sp. SYSU D01105]